MRESIKKEIEEQEKQIADLKSSLTYKLGFAAGLRWLLGEIAKSENQKG